MDIPDYYAAVVPLLARNPFSIDFHARRARAAR